MVSIELFSSCSGQIAKPISFVVSVKLFLSNLLLKTVFYFLAICCKTTQSVLDRLGRFGHFGPKGQRWSFPTLQEGKQLPTSTPHYFCLILHNYCICTNPHPALITGFWALSHTHQELEQPPPQIITWEGGPGRAEDTPYVMPHAARDVRLTEAASTATKMKVRRIGAASDGGPGQRGGRVRAQTPQPGNGPRAGGPALAASNEDSFPDGTLTGSWL